LRAVYGLPMDEAQLASFRAHTGRAAPLPKGYAEAVAIVGEAAELVKSYRCRRVTGDRYAGEWPREAFRFHRIDYEVAELDRSRLYLEFFPLVNAGRVELPDDPKLLRELRDLERRRGTAGRDRSITHPEDMTIVPTLWLAQP
jgi:hypothetical protein